MQRQTKPTPDMFKYHLYDLAMAIQVNINRIPFSQLVDKTYISKDTMAKEGRLPLSRNEGNMV